MKKSTNQTRQPGKLSFRRETIGTISSLTPYQLEKVMGGSGSSTQATCPTQDPDF